MQNLMDISGLLNNETLSFSSCSPGFAGLAPVPASSGFSVSASPSTSLVFLPVTSCCAIFCRPTNHVAGLVSRVTVSVRCLQMYAARIVSHIGDVAAHGFNQRIADASVGWSARFGRIVFVVLVRTVHRSHRRR